jgi:hypothetical protein
MRDFDDTKENEHDLRMEIIKPETREESLKAGNFENTLVNFVNFHAS